MNDSFMGRKFSVKFLQNKTCSPKTGLQAMIKMLQRQYRNAENNKATVLPIPE